MGNKENYFTFNDCFQLKEELLDALETLDEFITFKQIMENADYISYEDRLAFRNKYLDLGNALFKLELHWDYVYKEALD